MKSLLINYSLGLFVHVGGQLESSTSCLVTCQAPTTWEFQAWDIMTPVLILCKQCLWKGASSDNFNYFCLPLTNTFRLFRFIGLCAISKLGSLLFNVVSFSWRLYSAKQFWGLPKATLSRITLSGLNCAPELRASNLKQRDYCFHHLQTLIVEEKIVRQLD